MTGRGSYRFLPPFFFPPFAAFLAIGLSPPSCGIRSRGAFTVSQRRCHQARRRCVHTPLVASFGPEGRCPSDSPTRSLAGTRFARSARVVRSRSLAHSGELRPKKSGVQSCPSHPPDRRRRLALLAALFLAALCCFLCHEFLLGTVAAQLLPVTKCYNRWAERSTLIQDVDYG